MPYKIETRGSYFEVRVTGETSKLEILGIIHELDRLDPGKDLPDLWLVAGESLVPFVYFAEIAEAVRNLLPSGAAGNKTALVAADAFHEAQLEMYRSEASILPFPVRIFRSQDEAIEWIKEPEGPTTPVPEVTPGTCI